MRAACLAIALSMVISAHAGDGWETDFEAAKKMAAEKNLPILADFSGSDWCGWCIKLDKEVFSQDAWKAYAKDNVVMFLADFPRAPGQSEKLKVQNEALAAKYEIRGFPTVLLLKADGTVIEKTGYQRGGPEAYVKHIKSLIPAAAASTPAATDAPGAPAEPEAPAEPAAPEVPAAVDQAENLGTES